MIDCHNELLVIVSTQPCIPPGSLNRVPASAGGKGGNVTSAGWQVTLCDPIWHVSSRSGVATLRTAIHLLLTYLLTYLLPIQLAALENKTRSRRQAGRRLPSPEHAHTHTEGRTTRKHSASGPIYRTDESIEIKKQNKKNKSRLQNWHILIYTPRFLEFQGRVSFWK